MTKRIHPALTTGNKTVRLKCGCQVTGPPVTVYPGGRRVYRCPEHGLQDRKR